MATNLEPSDARPPSRFRPARVSDLFVIIASVAIVITPLAWGLHNLPDMRAASEEFACQNNLRQIAIALQNYHSHFAAFPPAYLTDANGRPTLSWRVLILPYLDDSGIFNRFVLDESWDGPNNRPLLDSMPPSFACPNHRDGSSRLPYTSYVAVTGPRTLFPGVTPRSLKDVTDDPGQTLMLVEVSNVDVPWTAPIDLDAVSGLLDPPIGPDPVLSSRDPRGPAALTADGIVHRLGRLHSTPEPTLRALTTIEGGEAVDWPPTR